MAKKTVSKKKSTTKKNLVIVESPAKAKTIEKYLGKNYRVVASVGHIRDLKKSSMSIDFDNNYEPEYINIRGKGPLINSLKKEAKNAKQVFLASDPDREGEAISWHLAHIFGLDENDKNRVVFNEITKDAVKCLSRTACYQFRFSKCPTSASRFGPNCRLLYFSHSMEEG